MEEKPYVCIFPECERAYRRLDHLKRHAQSHLELESERKPFTCPEPGCGRAFATNYKLRRHTRSGAHAASTPIDAERTSETPLQRRRRVRAERRAAQAKTHTCDAPDCGFSSQKWSELRQHVREAHPVQCVVCGKTFTRAYGLRCHMAQVHNPAGPPQVPCPVDGCGRTFSSRKTLDIHVNATHLQIKPWLCAEPGCGARFAHKHLLQRHKGVHRRALDPDPNPSPTADAPDELPTAEPRRIIPCVHPACTFQFSRLYDRDRHVAAQHPEYI